MARVIIGGPPHSGKSTFMTLMKRNFKGKNVNVGLVDLDLSSPTLEWLEGIETRSVRDTKKKPWTVGLAKKGKRLFKKCEKDKDLCLGDAPGKITNITNILSEGSNVAIILSRDKKENREWKKFYNKKKIPVLCEIDSELFGKGYFNPKKRKGLAVGMKRSDLVEGKIKPRMIAIDGCAHRLAEKFNLVMEDEE